jgi:U3 small nucleolar RNA-associated protein 4
LVVVFPLLLLKDSFGGPIWSLRAAPVSSSSSSSSGTVTQLAAACGDGSVKLFAVETDVPGAQYVSSLPRVEGKVLALAWHPAGHSVVSGGSDGCIHSWDLKQGEQLQQRAAASEAAKEALAA